MEGPTTGSYINCDFLFIWHYIILQIGYSYDFINKIDNF